MKLPLNYKLLLACLTVIFVLVFFSAVAFSLESWTEAPVINLPSDQLNASISGNKVVWQDYRNLSYGCSTAQNCLPADIYVKDLGGAEQRLTGTPNALDPDISGNLVVWRNWDTGKIVSYNVGTSTSPQNVSNYTGTGQQVSPAISGNKVAWVDYRNSTDYGDIYMRDLAAPADVPVALGDPALQVPQKDKRNPDIDGNIVVWEDWRNATQDAQGWWHNPDIYAKDVSTGTEYAVVIDTGDQYNPAVSGSRVFWQDYRNGNWDVYMKDLATGVETRLTYSSAHQSWPSASGDLVAWKDTRNGDEDIYVYEISTGAEQMVSNDPPETPLAAQKIPILSGKTAVWIDKRAGNWDIYSAKENAPPPALTNGKLKIYWASYADYQQRMLSIDFRLSNTGAGAAGDTQIAAVYATNGVNPVTPLPLAVGDIAAQASADYTIKYLVPGGVTNFTTYMYVSCIDGNGNLIWFPKPPPDV